MQPLTAVEGQTVHKVAKTRRKGQIRGSFARVIQNLSPSVISVEQNREKCVSPM